MKNLLIVSVLLVLLSFAGHAGILHSTTESLSVVNGGDIITATFSISNLGCKSDAANMEKAILRSKGVRACIVDVEKGTAEIKYNAKRISKEELVKVIEGCSLCHDETVKPFKVTSVK